MRTDLNGSQSEKTLSLNNGDAMKTDSLKSLKHLIMASLLFTITTEVYSSQISGTIPQPIPVRPVISLANVGATPSPTFPGHLPSNQPTF
jgi:hypothetical protein